MVTTAEFSDTKLRQVHVNVCQCAVPVASIFVFIVYALLQKCEILISV